MNPFVLLLKSRKFWLMVADVFVSFATYFVTKYINPEAGKDILFVIAGLQPVIITVIGAIAYEDGKRSDAASQAASMASITEIKRDCPE